MYARKTAASGVFLILGLALLALGKTSEAMVSYDKAIEQTSSKTPLITVLNLLYFLRDTKEVCQKIA
jgi:hypothetical protein